jgi:hypothetical protein
MTGKTKQFNLKILKQNDSIDNLVYQVYLARQFLTVGKTTVCSGHLYQFF